MKERLPLLAIVAIAGAIMGWSLPSGNVEVALTAFALAWLGVHYYMERLRKRGIILEDERILRISEISSRKTIQVIAVSMAIAVIVLSRFKTPKAEGAMIALDLALLAMIILQMAFYAYYSRRM
ncbi:DUF2178 domain-containing protein [Pyrococcus abyssi]|nr:DUF2178 domain-containing protein [Pyrococcus abyssi]